MAARRTALNIYELLEHIIAYLPPDKIINAERVCTTWKKVIDDSSIIRLARCLLPLRRNGQDNPGRMIYELGTGIRFNPALFLEEPKTNGIWESRYGLTPCRCRQTWHRSCIEYSMLGESAAAIGDRRELEAFEQLDGRMHLCNPPVRAVYTLADFVTIRGRHEARFTSEERVLHSEDGLRVGDVRGCGPRDATTAGMGFANVGFAPVVI